MAGDEAYDFSAIDGDECGACCESLLRGEFSGEVTGDAVLPILLSLPLHGADGCHGGDVGGFGDSDGDWHGVVSVREVGTSLRLRCLTE